MQFTPAVFFRPSWRGYAELPPGSTTPWNEPPDTGTNPFVGIPLGIGRHTNTSRYMFGTAGSPLTHVQGLSCCLCCRGRGVWRVGGGGGGGVRSDGIKNRTTSRRGFPSQEGAGRVERCPCPDLESRFWRVNSLARWHPRLRVRSTVGMARRDGCFLIEALFADAFTSPLRSSPCRAPGSDGRRGSFRRSPTISATSAESPVGTMSMPPPSPRFPSSENSLTPASPFLPAAAAALPPATCSSSPTASSPTSASSTGTAGASASTVPVAPPNSPPPPTGGATLPPGMLYLNVASGASLTIPASTAAGAPVATPPPPPPGSFRSPTATAGSLCGGLLGAGGAGPLATTGCAGDAAATAGLMLGCGPPPLPATPVPPGVNRLGPGSDCEHANAAAASAFAEARTQVEEAVQMKRGVLSARRREGPSIILAHPPAAPHLFSA